MFKTSAVLGLLVLCAPAHSIDVSGYEKLRQQAESQDPNRFIAKAFIESYFVGIAETLQFIQTGSQNVYLLNTPALCLPPNVQLSGPLLHAMLDAELRQPSVYQERLGPKWKEFQLIGFVMPGLLKMFPCQK